MYQNLFIVPHELFGIPVFGVGWLLLIWGAACSGFLIWTVKRAGWTSELLESILFFAVTGSVIVFVLPRLEIKAPNGGALGLPVRGYGTMMLCAVLAGWGLSARRAVRAGMTIDTINSLAWRLIIAGIIGARLFFVIEYWHEFQRPTWSATLLEMVKFTEGGLVVYGSMIGGFLAFVWFVRERRLSMLALGDVLAPCVILGMAIGRLGCILNGCCYGGECHSHTACVEFPRYSSIEQQVLSPPYRHQLATGRLHGFTLSGNPAGQPVVRSVDPQSSAEQSGLIAGIRIAKVNGVATPTVDFAEDLLLHAGPDISIEIADGQRFRWSIGTLPPHSRPVHPSQMYGAISGFLICMVLISIEPFFNRRGAVMASLLTLYPPIRFLEEIIRDDEPAQWGTALTISQLVSLLVLTGAMVTWYVVFRTEPREYRSNAETLAA